MADNLKLHGLDLLVVVAYMLICLVIGFYRSTRIKNPKQFALGYQNISATILICIIFASSIGGGTLLGYAEKLSLFGLAYLISKLFVPVGWLLTARVYSHNIGQFSDCVSISQIMYKLYGNLGRMVTTLSAIIMGVGVLVAQAIALGYVFNYFFGIDVFYGMLISYGILTIYTSMGGIRAVVFTEIFQFSIFFFIIPVSCIIALTDIGGLPKLIHDSPMLNWDFKFTFENFLLLGSLIFFTIVPECNAPFVQRCLMATNGMQLNRALKMVSLMSLFFVLSVFLIAHLVKVHSPDVADSEAFVFYISNYLPVGIKGLMVAGTIAIIMGLAEAWLNATSVIIVNDLVKVLVPEISNKKQLIALRATIIILSISAVIIASYTKNIIDVISLAHNLWEPLVLVPFVSGFLGFRTSSTSFTASIMLAMVFTFLTKLITGELAALSLGMGILGSAIGFFGTHFWLTVKTPAPKEEPKRVAQWLYSQVLKVKGMASLLQKFIRALYKKIIKITSPIEAPYQRFATFTLVYYFTYTLSLTSDPAHKILVYLLIAGYLMCFVLIFKDVVFSKNFQKKYLSLYWYCTLTFCLPSVSGYMLFASQGDDFWIINGLLSAFSLYFFVDAVTFIVLLSLGICFGYWLFLVGVPLDHKALTTHHTLENIGYIYLFFLFAYLTLFRGWEREHKEKIGQMHMLSGAIAHEVKTPFSSILMSNQIINEILGKDGAVKKIAANKYVITLEENEFDFLIAANQSVKKAGEQGIGMISNILNSLKSTVVDNEKKLYSIEECVKRAVADYSLSNPRAKEVKITIKDNFKVLCLLDYLMQVLFNLLKNAYKHGGQDVKIEILAEGTKLFFKDNGRGISKEDLPYIFDRYYTKSKTGAGIGLAFCKMVLEDLGGSIECKSELGKHTKFILSFSVSNS